ncbi:MULTISPECIES: hypothetical protein [Klebsiella]|nr:MULTISPECIES: hypothetical protein [Klebsiella]ELI7234531.1 hypothetical protein [Klebsiella pneumoniae]MBK1534547.1 hypothetical protein [Klebsiella pneumoniae]HEI9891649.1 hypothetical protein [Klebsiella pneumoniae]HEJ8623052.1 hypothetical protein [Klebsiella michiganensis]
MSQSKQSQGESKPQQPVEQKPTPSQGSADFTTKRVLVGDSADPFRRNKK